MRNSNAATPSPLFTGCKSQSPKLKKTSARPQEHYYDTLANDGTEIGGEREADEEQEERRVVKGQEILYQPSPQKWDDHTRAHIPFR